MSAESTGGWAGQSGPADEALELDLKIPQVSSPHNRDACQGLKAVCDLTTRGPSSQSRPSNACLPTPSSRDGLHSCNYASSLVGQPFALMPGHVTPKWRTPDSHLDSVGRNEKIRTHLSRYILGGEMLVSAKFRGQMLAVVWGSGVPSAHFLSRERMPCSLARSQDLQASSTATAK